jgi:hypothetical protein
MILTTAMALEPATCKALEKFVAEGGIVLADLCPGVWDDRGAYHSPGQLDSLFGVRRDGKFTFATMPADWGVGIMETEPDFNLKNNWLIGQYYEKSLKTADGHALGKHIFGAVQPPAFVFKRTGKGATILMNYLETEYRRVPEHWQGLVATETLKLAKIKPAVSLQDLDKGGDPITAGLKILRWQDGASQYVGVLLDQGRNTQIALPQAGFLYELSGTGGGRFLGQGAQATLDLRANPAALLAILPYKVEQVALKAGETVQSGQELPLEFSMKVSAGTPGKHVMHLDVTEPDGTYAYSLSRNFDFSGGQWRGTLPLALNDPKGTWTIKARDVTSGLTAEARVKVK